MTINAPMWREAVRALGVDVTTDDVRLDVPGDPVVDPVLLHRYGVGDGEAAVRLSLDGLLAAGRRPAATT